jgi:hypothetical protein
VSKEKTIHVFGYDFWITSYVPVPIGAVLPVGIIGNGSISDKIHRRHSMVEGAAISSQRTRNAHVLFQFPSNGTQMFVGPSFLLEKKKQKQNG